MQSAGFQPIKGFPLPDPATLDFAGYQQYIEEKMPAEDPSMYGLHPNAGIGNLINVTATAFDTIMILQGAGGGGGGGDKAAAISALVDEYTERLPENYNMFEIKSRIEDKTPYIMIVLQETERMNTLLGEMRDSLIELRLGLDGPSRHGPHFACKAVHNTDTLRI